MNTYKLIPAAELHTADLLVNKRDADQNWIVREVKRVGDRVLLETSDGQKWDLDHDYHARVLDLEPCDDCSATGVKKLSGYTENGVWKGTQGACYRCGGNGHLNRADRLRNWNYDNYVRRIY